MHGTSDEAIRYNMEYVVVPLLIMYGLMGCLFAIAEDATASAKHLDVVLEKCPLTGRMRIMCYGCSGGPFEITSLAQFRDEVKARGLATQVSLSKVEIPLCLEPHDQLDS